ncbi:M16 family metallopeptidase [Zafaria sp. Z1313]|uniref:M16 family metallopeptidase n=1 Tax=Zafaria sp. Z1313 TaxID=3423202 RepID=UPI003D302248
MVAHTREIDGVPVHWTEQPGRLSASLVFRIGVRDEDFATSGLTHLVEHLAFSAIPVPDHETNGSVSLNFTEFTVDGRPDEVVESLEAVCRSLSALAEGRVDAEMLARERAVLEAEGAVGAVPFEVGVALSHRFGLKGLGLAPVQAKYLDRIGPEDVARHAAEYFTRGNAVLVLSGEPPAGLRLPLPDGPRRRPADVPALPQAGPHEYGDEGEGVTLSFPTPGPADDASLLLPLVFQVLQRRVREGLRRQEGLVYDVDAGTVLVDDRRGIAVVRVNVAPRNAAGSARRIIDELRSLRDHGATQDEVRRVIAALESDGAEPGADQAEVYETALDELVGIRHQSMAEHLAAFQAYVPGSGIGALADLEGQLLVGFTAEASPETDSPVSAELLYPPRDRVDPPAIEGAVYKRGLIARFAGAPADLKLVIGTDGLQMTMFGQTISALYSEVVGLEHERVDEGVDGVTLFLADGFQIAVLSAWFRKGSEVVERLRSAVPERLHYAAESRPEAA